MKLMAFSDLHRNRGRAEHLVDLSRDADIVVGAGDYSTMRTGSRARAHVWEISGALRRFLPSDR
jgi:predicted phosphodiesterase